MPDEPTYTTRDNGYGISYRELEDMTEDFGPQGTVATRTIMVDWTDHYKVAPAFMGWSVKAGLLILREIPEKHPRYPWLFCTDVKFVRGVGAIVNDTNVTDFSKFQDAAGNQGKAVYEIRYQDVPYDVVTDAVLLQKSATGIELPRFVTRTKKWTLESLDAKGGTFQWTADSKKIANMTRVPYRMAQLEYKWWWVPEPIPESTIASTLGKVNSATFDVSTYATDAGNYTTTETVFFNTYHTERVRDALGQRCQHITYQFLYRPDGWNKIYRANGSSGPGFYAAVAADGSGVKPYLSADLDSLFTYS